ncbi:unnamed protein product [Mytilus coruscus]|uniref:Peptidase A2 domain-containing protein n=1 Tax=Mytilus coruscus TaxID=42192 RepID=A0A6J8BW33_MYTCO|nr:unnamed protein product [Mytilus coruscus]
MTITEKGDYDSLIKYLTQKFDPIQDPGVYLSQLHSMTQSSYKSLLQLSSAVFRLVCKAYPSIDSDSKQKMSSQYFIDALSDSDVQKQVRRLSPKTLAEAVDLALREESYVTLEKKRPKTQSLSEVDPSNQFSVFSKQLEELRECVGKLSVGNFSADRVEEAAIAPIQIPAVNTPNFGNRGGYGNGYRGRGGGNYGRGAQRGGYNSPGQFNGQNQNGGYVNYPDQNTGFTGQPQGNVPTFYGDKDNVRFLVDTGSTISLLNLEMYSSLTEGNPGLYTFSKNNLQFETVSGEVINSLGTTTVDIKVGIHVFTQQVVIADIPQSGILGVDFLDKFGAQMDFQKKIIQIDGNAFHLSSDTRKFCCKVSLSKDTYIPPNSEIITTGKIRFRGDWFPEGQIEPLSSLLRQNYSVLMARTLVNTVGNRVPIRLMNISDEPCTIPMGMGVGLVHTVQICQQFNRSSNTPRDPLLQSLLEEACVDLDDEQKTTVEKLLDKYSDIFLDKDGKLGRTDILQHVIDTGDTPLLS